MRVVLVPRSAEIKLLFCRFVLLLLPLDHLWFVGLKTGIWLTWWWSYQFWLSRFFAFFFSFDLADFLHFFFLLGCCIYTTYTNTRTIYYMWPQHTAHSIQCTVYQYRCVVCTVVSRIQYTLYIHYTVHYTLYIEYTYLLRFFLNIPHIHWYIAIFQIQ